ncbi:Panacea domain-containing protein [[Ruminococcus] lactaris]|uniref:Panacea domain-containing protein n=1 Tax=[Ruminococcus] lactaris TaxID=46228 RepID=UPI00204DCE94|nr:type II toxin-antitoxin system antitoxin SocA domain-containing protein [[Ruminococcus] lactaris]DAO93141.1 MAG TPA: hypothetical protein [Caudoviricetes sp.]
MMKYGVIDISTYIIGYSNKIDSPVSNLKLQKLLYYSQAAVLVETGEKCFDAPIMAWEFGPVVVEAYQYYRKYGRENIPNQEENKAMKFDEKTMRIVYELSKEIDLITKKIINKVVDSYSKVNNPFELVRKTHEEDPWKNTKLNQEIKCEEIRKYYKTQREKIYGV